MNNILEIFAEIVKMICMIGFVALWYTFNNKMKIKDMIYHGMITIFIGLIAFS